MRRSLADRHADEFDRLVRKSIIAANADLPSVLPFIAKHAQQLDVEVLKQHIAAFVTDFSGDLGSTGDKAVTALERMARQAGILS